MPYLVLMFISGLFFNFATQPRWVQAVANVFPLRWLLDAVRAGYLGRDFLHTSSVQTAAGVHEVVPKVAGIHAITALAPGYGVLALWLAGFAAIAFRRFSWEPRSR